jgi:phosphocarrier protein
MVKKEIEISNKLGLHARAAAKLSHLANSFSSEIFLVFQNNRINAKSLLGILTLGASVGNTIKAEFTGDDEEQAAGKIEQLFKSKFDEEK